MPEVEIVAACDRRKERAQAAADRAYSSAGEMFGAEALDFVDVVTQADEHLETVALAADRGLAVICQKPLASDWKTACSMVEIAEKRGIRLMVHDNWRWQPWYRAAKEFLLRGEVGTPIAYGFQCRTKDGLGDRPYPAQEYFRDLRRFTVDEVLVHHIDTARFLFGDIAAVYAEARRVNRRILGEDQAILTLSHGGGTLGWIDGNRFADHDESGPSLDDARIDGDSGTIRISPAGDVWSGGRRLWANDRPQGYRGDSVYAAQAHFIECLTTGRPFETEAREYLHKTYAVVEAAYASIASHRRVETAEILQRV